MDVKKINGHAPTEEEYYKKENKEEQEFLKQKWEEATKQEKKIIKNANLKNIYETVEKYLHVTDRNRIDIILATALSNQIPGTPIWMFIVGNSGDWKSAFTRSLEGMHNCIKIDQLTRNTLATGAKTKKGKDVPDLGYYLQNDSKILLFPDLASMTSMNTDEKNSIWGQFRNLYDGFICKYTGSGVSKKYENCHVTLIACTTQAIRDEILIHSQLGTRELMYDTKPDMVDNDMKMDKAWENEKFEEQMKNDIQKAVCDFLLYKKITKFDISSEMKEFLKQEAQRLSILRASGITDRIHKELINPIAPEIPTRLIKQFKRIYIALKNLEDDYPDEKAKEIISHIVDSSGNIVRLMVLDCFNCNNDWMKIVDVQQITRLGRKAVKAQLEMLWNMYILEKDVREERIGGYVSYDNFGNERVIGGRVEYISYYKCCNSGFPSLRYGIHKIQNI